MGKGGVAITEVPNVEDDEEAPPNMWAAAVHHEIPEVHW
jgi:hypothetical protein